MGRLKGSKAPTSRAKTNKKAPRRHRKRLMRKSTEKVTEKLCSVCQRVMWGEVQALPGGKVRHRHNCYPGTAAWLEYMNTRPKKEWTREQTFIFNHATEGR